MQLGNENALWLLWSLPALGAFYAYCFYRKRQALKLFADDALLTRINSNVSRTRQLVKAVLLLAAAGAVVIALTRPAWNPQPEQVSRRGRDIVILLDVSRSMLARDIRPNRLERAKLAIGDLLQELQGDRIAIIAFAGFPVLKCPLTHDYGFARLALADITTAGVARGGSLIGDAIRMATDKVFDQQGRDFKDIILITDGEDHDSMPVEAAEHAGQAGIRIFAIGLGDPTEGSRIPADDATAAGQTTFLQYQGEQVWSKLDSRTLTDIVLATPGGKYLNVATGNFDLVELYRDLIAGSAQKQLEATTVLRYDEKFQIFLALALVLLVIEVLISERKRAS